MLLTSGSRLGPYEVISTLGAGGMGEVYRARDGRLDREVALKVIAAEGAPDPDRLRRFEQEARAVAALDHPHILAVHDVGSHNGMAYVVFELLEGETLRDRLDRGPLPARKSVELAVQVCAGLAAAHARGITHRDLKPENLFLTKDGRLKILDFGLAKLTEPLGGMVEDARTQTRTDRGTWRGTAGYVSPEQVREGRADSRSDLFALGAVLYEMLAGRRAFRGPSSADTLSAILNSDPPPITSSVGPVPATLERVVRRCLEKDPEERFQSARDVGFALEALSGSGSGSGSGEAAAVDARLPPSRRWRRAGVAVLALVAAAAGGLAAGRSLWPKPIPTFKQLTFRRGWISLARFAPDGRTVIYAAGWDGKPTEIFSTRTDTAESRPLGLQFARVLSVSSTGQLAILTDPRQGSGLFSIGTLAVMPLGGGAPRELVQDVLEADWTPDGRDLCVLRRVGGEHQIELPPGTVIYRPHRRLRHMRMAPTGRHVAFLENAPGAGVNVVSLDLVSRQPRVLGRVPYNTWGLAWTPKGDEVWFTGGATQGRRDIVGVDMSGRHRLVYRSSGVVSLLDISPDGRVLLHRSIDRAGVIGRGPDEQAERDLSVFDDSSMGALSADGRTLIINEAGGPAGPVGAVYLRRTEGGDPVRLGDGVAFDLSPDGKSVLSWLDAPARLTEVRLGPGLPRTITVEGVTPSFAQWVPPLGDWIAVFGREAGRLPRLWVVSRNGGKPRPITPEGPTDGFAISPDGSKVALSIAPGTISIVPLEGGDTREIRGLPQNLVVRRWSGDGRSIFLIERYYGACEVHRLDLATEQLAVSHHVAPSDPTGVIHCSRILPSADGPGYAYEYERSLTDIVVAEGLR
jgi:hypothetical protein